MSSNRPTSIYSARMSFILAQTMKRQISSYKQSLERIVHASSYYYSYLVHISTTTSVFVLFLVICSHNMGADKLVPLLFPTP